MKVIEILTKKHKGIGGLYFITTSIICAAIMTISFQLSWDSQVVAMANNLAYITSINATVNYYVNDIESFESYNPSTQLNNGENYSPLKEFNKMLKDAGLSQNGSSTCRVKWDGKETKIKFGEFKTSLNTYVKPHQQESIIEKN